MYIKEMMDKIVKEDDAKGMNYLGEEFVNMAHYIKEHDKEMYKNIAYNLQVIAHDGHLTEEQAKCWVYGMKNKDGTVGEHWSWDDTEVVRREYMLNADPCDFYAVLNMMYSDYCCTNFNDTTYINLAKDWLNDADVSKCKTLMYYIFVIKD